MGVSSFAAYREAGKTDLPLIVLMIDNLTALKELYFQDDEELLSLCRESLTVGISIVIANSHTSGIGYKYLSNFSSRIALFCNDSSEYSSLFEHCSERIENIPGRCIVDLDKRHLECQSFLAFDGEKEHDRAIQIRDYIAQTNKRNSRMMANIMPVIPEVLSSRYVASTFSGYMSEPGLVAVGLDYSTVSPMVLDFSTLGVLAISGRENAGKHNFMRLCARMLEKTHPGTSEIYIVDGIRRKLSDLREEPNVVSYDFLASNAVTLVKEIEQKLKQRYDLLAAGKENALENEKLIVLILNSTEAMELVSMDPGAVTAYRNITGKYKNMKICVLLGQYENTNIPYSAPELIKKAKEAKHFIFFDDLANLKILDLPMTMLRNYKKPIETGDAYYIKENKCMKLKTAIDRQ
jgi:S-DNA-T family DNA segregation ATPase FtsK/SpoIIIE